MARKLKVFRSAIGFHDAYVAASSRKAALAAWGADADLFARGVAEEVTDEALMAEPLAQPGTVVKRVRGSMAEHLAALPEDQPAPKDAPAPKADKARRPSAPAPRLKPRPDRSALDAAEEALSTAGDSHDAKRRALADREAALRRERQALEKRMEEETDKLTQARDAARARYDKAMKAWRG
ncbi:hypothetical protein WG907_01555 [Sphingobium sp. AN558]|uniref:hypothetical protein n=1 Tax=Sphingobium sp. AN558 TaxID=3133442 RepID=UPI0030C504D2